MKSPIRSEQASNEIEEEVVSQEVRARKKRAKYITVQLAKDFRKLGIEGRMHPPEVYKDPDIAAVFGLKKRRNTGTWVDLFQTAVSTPSKNKRDFNGDVTYGAWCASFLQWILASAESRVQLKSAIHPSKLVMKMWKGSEKAQLTWFVEDSDGRKLPRLAKKGWIAVWSRTPKEGFIERPGTRELGHAELVIEDSDSNLITTIGGNTVVDPAGRDASNGNKVVRHLKHDPRKFGMLADDYSYEFLGYLAPWGKDI